MPTTREPQRTPREHLRSWLQCTLYALPAPNRAPEPDEHKLPFVLPITRRLRRYGLEDIYGSRLNGADMREALSRHNGKPYMPPYRPRRDPVTGERENVIEIGYSDGDPTGNAAHLADINRTVLERQPETFDDTGHIPATVMRWIIETELAGRDAEAAQAVANVGHGLSIRQQMRRDPKQRVERQIKRVNARALDATLALCVRYLQERSTGLVLLRAGAETDTE